MNKFTIEVDPGTAKEGVVINFLAEISVLLKRAGLGGLKWNSIKPKRHPSEITLEEFIEVAKIIHPMMGDKGWSILIEEDDYLVTLSMIKFNLKIEMDWSDLNGMRIESVIRNQMRTPPEFFESLKIARYLDQIGIEYRAQNEEA